MLRTIACADNEHSSCFGQVKVKGFPTTDRTLGPCECGCHDQAKASAFGQQEAAPIGEED